MFGIEELSINTPPVSPPERTTSVSDKRLRVPLLFTIAEARILPSAGPERYPSFSNVHWLLYNGSRVNTYASPLIKDSPGAVIVMKPA